ncbi:hypothetical protein [Mammaliicoccus lentus]|uniref:hypothetical protein n=1 Tax=Mammaliicoccus lentus TaxID=42858 RepID=UPI0010721537|nr:hypothetical protein [Mammaliicoccus lentus]MBF0793372.1 hypothetical protein [Mammaliicoccus lentus]TFV17873.1 hypothetical protein E4T78_01815 [Mammaliicoccus lentus]
MSGYKLLCLSKEMKHKDNLKDVYLPNLEYPCLCEFKKAFDIEELQESLRIVLGFNAKKDKMIFNSEDNSKFIVIVSEDESELPDVKGKYLSYYHCKIEKD